jgi:hypothetical protein
MPVTAIISFAGFNPSAGVPEFAITIGDGTRYRVEITNQHQLIGVGGPVAAHYDSGIQSLPGGGTATYSMPPPAWQQLDKSAGHLYFALTAAGPGGQIARSFTPGHTQNAPRFSLTATAESIEFTSLDVAQTKTVEHAWKHIMLKATYPAAGTLPASASAALRSRETGDLINLILVPYEQNGRVFVSDPVFLHGADGDFQSGFQRIRVGYTDELTAQLDSQSRAIAIHDLPALAGAAHPGGFVLAHHGLQSITVDPANGQNSRIAARLTRDGGEPIAGARLIWRIEGHSTSFITTTDEDGISDLEFLPDRSGRFAVFTDGLMLGEQVSRGPRTVTVVPEDHVFYSLLEQDVPRFTVNLIAPTTIRMVQLGGQEYGYIVSGDELYFEVYLGDADLAQFAAPPDRLDTTLTDFDGNAQSVELTRDVYPYKFVSRSPITLTSYNTDRRGAPVGYSWRSYTIQLPMYIWDSDPMYWEGYKALNELRTVLIEARRHPGLSTAQAEALAVKSQLVANGMALLSVNHAEVGTVGLAAGLAAKYLELVQYPIERLGQPIDVPASHMPLPQVLGQTPVRYVRSVEQAEIESIIRHWMHLGSTAVLNAAMVLMLETVKFILAPLIGAYTAVTGQTVEGQRASLLERVLGGIDAMLALIPVAMAVSRYGRAARSYRRQLAWDPNLPDAPLQRIISDLPFQVPAIRSSSALTELSQAFRVSTRAEVVQLKKAFYSERNIQQLRRTIERHQTNLANKRSELDNLLQRETAQGPSPELSHDINRARGRINDLENQHIPNRRAELQHELTRHRQAARKLDELYLGREMAREDLEFLQQEGLIPGAHDKFNGTAANRIYEFQINEHLVDPSTPTAWTEAHPRPVVAAYRPTRWGTRPHFEVGPPMRGLPRPDHMNIDPVDLRIGDSKYFTWWPDEAYQAGVDLMAHEFIADRIDQMVRTIEKGRLVQFTEIRRAMPNAPPSAVWRQVFQKEFYIFTPVDVPPRVADALRTSVMGAGQNLHFITVPVDLDAWLRAL